MYMTVNYFRAHLKEALDKALVESVFIERGGIQFELKAAGVVGKVIQINADPERSEFIPTIKQPASSFARDQKYCKNGHAIDDRGRCFGKGCKYS